MPAKWIIWRIDMFEQRPAIISWNIQKNKLRSLDASHEITYQE